MWKRARRGGPRHGLQLAAEGYGPLLRRDYWAVIRNARATPRQVMAAVRAHFPAFAPAELARFTSRAAAARPLAPGDELDVRIAGAGMCRVQVVHADDLSFTLATEPGHPEAGRITFGCYRNRRGDPIFHVRSVARASSRFTLAGFRATGEVMQTSTWTDFVNRVAVAFGEGPLGFVHAETRRIPDEAAELARAPTFLARA